MSQGGRNAEANNESGSRFAVQIVTDHLSHKGSSSREKLEEVRIEQSATLPAPSTPETMRTYQVQR